MSDKICKQCGQNNTDGEQSEYCYDCFMYIFGDIDEDEDDDYWEEQEEREQEELACIAAECTCGAYVFNKIDLRVYHIADCYCGAG